VGRIWIWIKAIRPPQLSVTTWIIVGLAACVVILFITLNHEKKARLEAERQVEATELKAKGELVAEDTKAADLKIDLEALQREFAGLKMALEIARKKIGVARLVEVDKFLTVPVPVLYGSRDSADGGCVLEGGDSAEIRIAELRLQTKLGNDLAIGVAQAWRLEPGPPTLLFSSAFQASTSQMKVDLAAVSAPKLPGWGAGPWLAVGTAGVGAGAVVATPVAPFLFGTKIEGTGAFSVGPGNFSIGVGAIVR